MSNSITVWVKTTLWAHYGDRSNEDHYAPMGRGNLAYFRYRPSLGTDWTPDTRQRSSYGSPRYTLCELDGVKHAEDFKYFTTDFDQDIRQVLSRRRIPPLVDRELLKTWIQECQTNHKHCMAAQNNQQVQLRSTGRFRVIDVETMCLFVPSEDISYIAVSYVWGGILHSKTNSEPVEWIDGLFYRATPKGSTQPTSPELHNRLHFQKLPLTIQDSIRLVKLLGWRYLWIDLLCIRQNDAADKQALVNKMHLIYEEASFTIVAAGGQDANKPLAGLFSPRSPEPVAELVLRNESITIASARPALPDLLAQTTWAKRGWTFQEDVLSRCCLYFTETEVFYSCRHHLLEYHLPCDQYTGFGYGRFSEWRESLFLETRIFKTAYQDASRWNDGWTRFGNSSGSLRSKASVLGSHGVAGYCAELDYESAVWDPEEIFLRKAPGGHDRIPVQRIPANKAKQLFEEYASFVTEYSKRDLSYSSDAVAAMMGILTKFNDSSAKPVTIEAHGILSDQLEKGLLWMPLNDTSLQRRNGFPSWSWAGWSGSVAYEIAHDQM
ncbi:uncharacterized protein FTOL_12517 [Fusarium torulosum]|uniref:Heterokaryon incompatibility domain-containing protein n=1 Tax=Fusarium torulosum TaxID=33205 RepID=A0AAE8MKA6_9HYPO|nr:uncharacterized protein FTOL_12517 [Fusarium torulosum]